MYVPVATLTHRLQLLLDDDRMTLLRRESHRRRISVAALIREAVDARFAPSITAAREAVDTYLHLPPVPVGEWEAEKRLLRDDSDDSDDSEASQDDR
jgi:hypothetical protein